MKRPDRSVAPAGLAGLLILLAAFATPSSEAGSSAAAFELKDGDRVVLLGGTFVERDAAYGYLETLLTARFPDRSFTFRNLGWSGDTVRGEARARFGPAAEGFAHLEEHVEALKPTVILVSYGLNESFAGKPGLPAFEQDLNTLLDVLDKTGARIVLITPRQLETLPPPLPDPAAANERLDDYVAVFRQTAARRRHRLIDLFSAPSSGIRYTDNGIHLNAAGYSVVAHEIAGYRSPKDRAELAIEFDGRVIAAMGSKVEDVKATPGSLSFRLTLDRLPIVWSGDRAASRERAELDSNSLTTADLTNAPQLSLAGIGPGTYRVRIDGNDKFEFVQRDGPAAAVPGKFGRTSVDLHLNNGPDAEQMAALRRAIRDKNELYFHRWRPQNETYLFGFRKHEQGNNAREIPLFDPLVAAKEREISRLKVPITHTYEITRIGEGR